MLADSALRVIQIQARPCSQEGVFFFPKTCASRFGADLKENNNNKKKKSYVPRKERNTSFVSGFII